MSCREGDLPKLGATEIEGGMGWGRGGGGGGGIPTYITYLWYVGIGRDGCTEERSKMTYSSSDGTRDRPHCTPPLSTRQDQVPGQGSSIGSRWG